MVIQKKNENKKEQVFTQQRYFRQRKNRVICLGKNEQRVSLDGTELFKYKVNIKVKVHNVFCTLSTTATNKILHSCSSGNYKVKMSKKTLSYTYYWFLRRFYSKVKKCTRVSATKMLEEKSKITRRPGFVVNLIGPTTITSNIANVTRYILKKRPFVINADDKKIFNGCRARKRKMNKRDYNKNKK